MIQAPNNDGVLLRWGDRLVYPANRIVRVQPQPKLNSLAAQQRAATSASASRPRWSAARRR
jgi:hypothetical protein